MKDIKHIVEWLLEGDVAIQYQVHRDLLSEDCKDLQAKIQTEGWGARMLKLQNPDGHWGRSYYQPKWTSTHYTLLDLRNLCLSSDNQQIGSTIDMVLIDQKGKDGGIDPSVTIHQSDVCLNGMFLNFACYFKADANELVSIVDFILEQRMPDGGFNCRLNRSGAVHSSLHSTLSVAEGIREYDKNGYRYRLDEMLEAEKNCVEFILQHRLFLSDRTGKIIQPGFLKLAFPCRWRYDILRAMDYLRDAGREFDRRMQPAFEVILRKCRKDGTWTSSKHQGQTHFDMEISGRPSRWNTLRALRVLEYYRKSLLDLAEVGSL